ncbi:MAG: pimeloyl-ACP methyl ester esterase BioH [Steroidobacteraceae bacterium]|nr:pimeloyl-ACP methyl ester esterase BioH [Steroidobacteraceae bacterium]MBP7015439.1 pimeloyl-ACP methyl ester esterase BioH [Steroidobacteraceae bacterium]
MNAPLHVEIRGTGPDLVLLHGWALHGGMWGPWIDELARRARLHLIDLPGHGRSRWPEGASTLRDLARAVSPHVPQGAAVLGWSLGGMVALELARLRPGDLAALVLIATTPCFLAREDWPAGMNPGVLDGFAAGLAGDYRRTLSNFLALQTWGDENASQALRSLRANLDAHGEPEPQALVAGLGILRTADLRAELATIAIPSLVIAGEHDRITPVAAGRELASRLPSARFVEVPKAGHAPFLSHPETVLREVEGFLSFLAPASARSVISPASAKNSSREGPGSTATGAGKAAAGAGSAGDGNSGREFALDVQRVRASFSQAAASYDAAAVLQSTVRDELLRRLEVLRMAPAVVVDLGAGTGQGSIALKRRYPGGRVVAMDIAHGMLLQARKRQTLLRRFDRVVADAAALPLGNASVDMLFSSLMLQWCNDPDRVLRECRRVLRPGGVLHFTTLGPDTLVELRQSWQAADPSHAHVNRFIDMHDLGDALLRAGFAEPVLDVEHYTLTYDDARGLMRDLKAIGAHNSTAGRARGLTGKSALARMLAAYEGFRREGKLPATYEVVFAQAWCPTGPIRSKGQLRAETVIPISQIRRRNY